MALRAFSMAISWSGSGVLVVGVSLDAKRWKVVGVGDVLESADGTGEKESVLVRAQMNVQAARAAPWIDNTVGDVVGAVIVGTHFHIPKSHCSCIIS